MDRILISACLIGDNVKYDGGNNLNQELLGLLDYYELVPFCPEVEGGLPIPRIASEVRHDRVRNQKGKDVTNNFESGASKAVSLCSLLGIRIAILKERSPSCGVHQIHNGNFDGTLIPGDGITTRKLKKAGIQVMNEEEALAFLQAKRDSEERGKVIKAATIAKEEKEKAEQEKAAKIAEEKAKRDGERKPYRKPRPYGDKPSYRKGDRPEKGGRPYGKKPYRQDGKRPSRPFKGRKDDNRK